MQIVKFGFNSDISIIGIQSAFVPKYGRTVSQMFEPNINNPGAMLYRALLLPLER